MTRYNIRSMSTTDFVLGSNEPVKPYRGYLLPPEKRCGAYWSRLGPAMTFDGPEIAYQEALASEKVFDIAPVGDPGWRDFETCRPWVAAISVSTFRRSNRGHRTFGRSRGFTPAENLER